MKKIFYLIAVLALGMTACSKNEIQAPAEGASDAPVYRVSLPTSFDAGTGTKAIEVGGTSITSTFSSEDKVYVFIKRDQGSSSIVAAAHNGTDAYLYLTPRDIKGSSCTL
ncbi:MAG: hypothetical protein J5831_06005, partial [Bacteroidales bacterium]|nr:hypothetical protein [Bacteroidales bacterium]